MWYALISILYTTRTFNGFIYGKTLRDATNKAVRIGFNISSIVLKPVGESLPQDEKRYNNAYWENL